MRLDEVTDTDVGKMVSLFGDLLKICQQELGFEKLPKINWVSDGEFSKKHHTFGSFQPGEGIVTVSITGRHIIDMMRTLAHELVHYKQMLDGRLGPNAGETGSPIENEANAMAGVIMRKFDHMHPEAFAIKPIMEDTRAKLNRLLAEETPQITPGSAARTVAGIAGRKVPGVGLGLKASDAAQDMQQGKPISALWNLASGAASMVPGPGTAISAGMDMAKGAYDAVAGNNTPAPAPAAPKTAAPKAAPRPVPTPLPRPDEFKTAPDPQQVAAEPKTDAETLNELLGEVDDDSSASAPSIISSMGKQEILPNYNKSSSSNTPTSMPTSPSLSKVPTPRSAQTTEPTPAPLSVSQVQTHTGPVRTGSAQVGAGPIVGQFSTSDVGGNADTGIGSQRSNTTNLSTALPLGLRAGVTSNQSNGKRNNTVDISKNLSLGDKGNVTVGSNIPTNGGKPSYSGNVNYGGLNANATISPGGQKQFTVGYNKSFESIKRLNDLLAEHSVEIGHIYGNKKLPKTKDKIHSADKGKVHRGLRISEVVGTGTPEVYVDMDGVLADFFKDWNRMVGVGHWKEIKDPEAALDMIRKNPTFWIDLDVLSNAPRLLGAIKKFANSYYICTSPLGKDPNCEPQKREWAKKYLSAFAPKEVYVTHNKPQFAVQPDGTPNVLIDDFGKNIVAWQNAGGIGIHYENNNVESAIKQLKVAMSSNHPQTTSDQSKLATAFQGKSTGL